MSPESKQLSHDADEARSILSWNALLLPWMVMFLSWGLLVIVFLTPWHVLIDHDYLLRTSHLPWIIALVVFLLCWQVMTLAMMVPSSFSRLVLLHEMHRARWRAQVIFLMSYALVWTGFAFLAFVGDTLVHLLVQRWWWLSVHPQLLGALTLALAGVYQWSRWKRRCLRCCIALTQAQRSASLQEAFFSSWKQGWHYGTWCLGSNWALMLVMFGVGMRSLAVLALLTAIPLLEREIFKEERFRFVVGSLFLGLSLLWYLFPLRV